MELSDTEMRAVENHRCTLEEELGRDVALAEAEKDWLEHHASEWRRRRQQVMLEKQREEMRRHRWIESEKARCDVGKQAYMDWIQDHAASWRKWYDENEESFLEEDRLV